MLKNLPKLLFYWLIRTQKVMVEAIRAWVDHRASSKGAALAFYTLFSLTPILVLAIALAGYFFGAEAARGELFGQIERLTGPSGAQTIQSLLAASDDPESGRFAALVASGLLLLGASTVFAELKSSLDELWDIKPTRSGLSAFLRTRLVSAGLVLVLALLLLVSLVVSAVLAVLERLIGGIWANFSLLFSSLASLVSFLIIASLFAVIYKMLPDAPLSWRDVATGALFTAGLFILGKFLIGLYLGNSAVASGFGAAGSVIALLLWVYYSAQIFFLGAEFTRQNALMYGSLRHQKILPGKTHGKPESPAGPA